MGMGQMPLLAALTDKMRWHQARQTVLAANIANAETPGYRAQDLKSFSFEDHLRNSTLSQVTTAATEPGHFSVSSSQSGGFGAAEQSGDFETSPGGNAVSLEDEMMKLTGNQMDYQAITTLYSRSLRIIRAALGRQA